jgi:hypothetical protein
MTGQLLAYDDAGTVVATLDYMVTYDASGRPIGLVDFAAHEAAGGEATVWWVVNGPVKGSKVWPQWLGSRAMDYRVTLTGKAGHKRISALVHRDTGERIERKTIEKAITARIKAAQGAPADIRDLVGGPDRPLK